MLGKRKGNKGSKANNIGLEPSDPVFIETF